MRKLSELLDLHGDLDAMFFEHQRKLLRFEFPEALRLLEVYEKALVTHINDEDTHLLPIYATRGEQLKGGAVQMFYDEHEKLKAHIAMFKDEIGIIANDPEPDSRLIWLLERESFFKKLCDHHDIRETNFLYPELDRITSDEEKVELFGRITDSFSGRLEV
ncbi:MAG: hypothetical protein IPN69_23025 [Acidobacteria bacterium]|nr:hypothetical protein [Acidobacteriota bacterium]MBK8148014.1 hypothetical protein [Acidobacteriota bacterium]MBK8813582.1 hypothetical protein [Acidobacteriota bacterium]